MGGEAIPDSLKKLHGGLSRRAVTLLERCRVDPELLDPLRFRDGDLPAWVRSFPFPLQSWPTFVAGAKLREVRRAAVEVAKLVKSVPRRVLDDDPERIGRFYGLDAGTAAAIFTDPDGVDPALARGDFIDTDRGFRCIEMNMNACLGGWQLRFFIDRFLARPWVADLAGREPAARYVDPLIELFRHLTRRASEDGLASDDEANIAFLVPGDSALLHAQDTLGHLADEYRRFQERERPFVAGELVLASYGDIVSRDSRIYVGGRRIHAVVDYQNPEPNTALFRSFKAGYLHYYNGPAGLLLRDKRNLALLSEHAATGRFDDVERKLVEDHVPWTRVARDGVTDFHGERAELPRFVLANRRQLVLKPALGMGGDSVWIGRSTRPDVWDEVTRRAFSDGGWLVQERMESLPYWYQRGAAGACAHAVVWGLFAFGDRYGGGFLRMMPRGGGGVINAAKGAEEGIILEIEGSEDGSAAGACRAGEPAGSKGQFSPHIAKIRL